MHTIQHSLIALFKLAVVLFVPAVVWTTLMAGLYQLVRDRVMRFRMMGQGSQELARESAV